MSAELTYKSQILIGVRANGVKTVIADWSHVPKQAEVLQEIQKAGTAVRKAIVSRRDPIQNCLSHHDALRPRRCGFFPHVRVTQQRSISFRRAGEFQKEGQALVLAEASSAEPQEEGKPH